MHEVTTIIKKWILDPDRQYKVILYRYKRCSIKSLDRDVRLIDWASFFEHLHSFSIDSFEVFDIEVISDLLSILKFLVPPDSRSWLSQIFASQRPEKEVRQWYLLQGSYSKYLAKENAKELLAVRQACKNYKNSLLGCSSIELNDYFSSAYKEIDRLEKKCQPIMYEMDIAIKTALNSLLSHMKSWRIEVFNFHQVLASYFIDVLQNNKKIELKQVVEYSIDTLSRLQAAHLITRVDVREDLEIPPSPFIKNVTRLDFDRWCSVNSSDIQYSGQKLEDYLKRLFDAEHQKRQHAYEVLYSFVGLIFDLTQHYMPN